MDPFFFPIFNFFAKNKWAQYALLAVITAGAYLAWLAMHDHKIREQQRMKQRLEAAREQARVEKTKQDIQERRANGIQAAKQAGVDHVVRGSVDELRARDPGLADLVYGPADRGGGQTEGR